MGHKKCKKLQNTLMNENITYQHFWDVVKEMLKGKCIAVKPI